MHPSVHARANPDKPALIIAETGRVISFGELDARSNQGAHLLRQCGLQVGDAVAVLLENHPLFLEIAWAAQRAGLYLVALPSRLTLPEIEYILRDCNARAFITSSTLGGSNADELARVAGAIDLFMIDETAAPFRSWENEVGAQPSTPIKDERAGADMLYSSGTTGRPKGIRPPLAPEGAITTLSSVARVAQAHFGIGEDSVYLCPAPLYHAAPLRWSMATQQLGGTVVLMKKFDAVAALEAIERYRVTVGQWVPTHFIRMLQLPQNVRDSFDLSSMRRAIHAAAPCPVPVKQAMIAWWGPILKEYYAGTESNGMTAIDSAEWLTHQGSVGRAIKGTVRICDENGEPLPAHQTGLIYFEAGGDFEYHNDPAKTAEGRNTYGWTTIGDIGWLDDDGYLYLTDRKSFMIISGGVNIYPQEIENLLATHPKIADAAVIGVPDAEMGERVVAVVQPLQWQDAGPAFAEELNLWMRGQLSGVKVPKQIDFRQELPREPTGKLYKRLLRDEYRAAAGVN